MAGKIDLTAATEIATACRKQDLTPSAIVAQVLHGIAHSNRPEAWTHVIATKDLESRAKELEAMGPARDAMPLFGVPIAIKDNIDVAGVPTTAGCPAYAYIPERSATLVEQLVRAGAIIIGKTHMDQFATGLVGTRNPHGPCRNVYDPSYISGGSSSGSAVVVAQGLVSLALGTDTAGSGRVPAVLNGIVGLKPTRGLLSLRGVVPACLSLDCVSIFASNRDSAALMLDVLSQSEPDHFTCRRRDPWLSKSATFRFGALTASQLEEIDDEGKRLYADAIAHLKASGGEGIEIDYAPFLATSRLLYGGPWVAERHAAVGDFIEAHLDCVDPAVAKIITSARALSARQVFEGMYGLRRLQHEIAPVWESIDCLVVPTVARAVRIEEALRQPIDTSVMLGLHNNFMNLLDLSGCALPTAMRECGVPFGVTLCAPPFAELRLLDIASRFLQIVGFPSPASLAGEGQGEGSTRSPSRSIPRRRAEESEPSPLPSPASDAGEGEDQKQRISFVVVGAHLRGMPLNPGLVSDGGRFEAAVKTSSNYKLYALRGTVPPKPGLCRVEHEGASIEAEVWSLPADAFGRFVAAIPRPLGMGRVTLDGGAELPGFICEPEALEVADDITAFGGWKAYMRSKALS